MQRHDSRHQHHHDGALYFNAPPAPTRQGLNATALSATVHCLTGCAIGEVLGMIVGTALGMSNAATIVLAVLLAFAFGYAFTIVPLRRTGLAWATVLRLALAADTASITIMELADNGVMLLIPGAMDASLTSSLFWMALAGSLLIAGVTAYPVNRWLIARGKGHAVVHGHHTD